jgi:hypothetical protein
MLLTYKEIPDGQEGSAMTPVAEQVHSQAARRAAVRATLAPSVHNTQPWRFVRRGNVLELHADWSRKLSVLDPTGRQLVLSCGCALFNARVAIASAGHNTQVDRLPDPYRSAFLARLTVSDETDEPDGVGALDAVIELRQTNRRRFAEGPVPEELVDTLIECARVEGANLVPVVRPEHRTAVASLSQQADRSQNADPAYRAELRSWTTEDPQRRDGVRALSVPHVDGGAHDDVPIRDFDTHGVGYLPVETQSSMNQCLLLLGTMEDRPESWLRAGEALERVLLEIARHGYAASPLTQVIENAATRAMLRNDLGLTMYPHVLLRVGRAAITPGSRRRRLADVLDDID